MGIEIERKFLVRDDSYRKYASEKVTIKQGYLSRTPERTVRVRIWNEKGKLTIKGITRGCTREEFEYDIPLEDALRLLDLCVPPVLEKVRYITDINGNKWEIDEFKGQLSPLVVAEIELDAECREIELPSFIGKEVTGDPSYYNSNL